MCGDSNQNEFQQQKLSRTFAGVENVEEEWKLRGIVLGEEVREQYDDELGLLGCVDPSRLGFLAENKFAEKLAGVLKNIFNVNKSQIHIFPSHLQILLSQCILNVYQSFSRPHLVVQILSSQTHEKNIALIHF